MRSPEHVIGALADIFTWVGLGGAAALGILTLVLALADGTWLPVRAVVEPADRGRVVRWIDADGGVNEAPLSPHEDERIGAHDMADVFYRRGRRNRIRLTRGSPAVRSTGRLAVGFGVIGLVAAITSWVLLALQG